MANINKIRVNGTTYDIEDTTARSGTGLTSDIKQALLDCFDHVAWSDTDGRDYYDALESALYPPATLTSISAVYTQSGTVYNTDSLDSLKSNLVVTAHFDDSSTATVTTYTLSGTLTVGTSTITVSYGGKTTTFTVTVTEAPTLSSISAVYTQSGIVSSSDTLNSLKSDLVVTATWSDSTTTTVSSSDYTLSGTLTVGTSTITVSYGGKTDTFSVTVTAPQRQYLYNWDFTQSLTDSVSSQVATTTAKSGVDAPAQGNTGVVFNAATQIVYLGNIDLVGKTIEIDVASFVFAGSSSYHVRFLMTNAQVSGNQVGSGPVIYRSGNGWTSYGYTDSTHNAGSYRLWSGQGWGNLYTNVSGTVNAFNGKTVKVVFGSDGHTKSLYLDDAFVATMTDVYFNHDSSNVYLGGISTTTASNGDQCFNMTVSAVRIYENESESETVYTITNTLSNATNSNGATSVYEGDSYNATITANSGYALSTVTVTMGGTDVTSTVYSNGTITIASVSGNIVITVTTQTYETPIYNWDFTTSLTDTIGGVVATLGGSATQSSSGLTLTSASDYLSANIGLSSNARRIEIDVSSYDRANGATHGRILTHSRVTTSQYDCGAIWRNTGYLAIYEGAWTNSDIADVSELTNATISYSCYAYVGGTSSVSLNGTEVCSYTHGGFANVNDAICIGSSQGQSAYNLVVAAMRVYELT